MAVRSLEWGFTGKCDLVEIWFDESGSVQRVLPVEFKRGREKGRYLVLDQHELSCLEAGIQTARRICQNQPFCSHTLHQPYRQNNIRNLIALIMMDTPFHNHDPDISDPAEYKLSAVPLYGRNRKAFHVNHMEGFLFLMSGQDRLSLQNERVWAGAVRPVFCGSPSLALRRVIDLLIWRVLCYLRRRVLRLLI